MSKYLLDTHTLLWMFSGDARLSSRASEVLCDSGNNLFFSMASYWELCIKISIGKLELQANWEKHLDNEMKSNGIQMLSIYPEHCLEVVKLPWVHRDPFDRLLLAQARVESATLISADQHFNGYPGVDVVW